MTRHPSPLGIALIACSLVAGSSIVWFARCPGNCSAPDARSAPAAQADDAPVVARAPSSSGMPLAAAIVPATSARSASAAAPAAISAEIDLGSPVAATRPAARFTDARRDEILAGLRAELGDPALSDRDIVAHATSAKEQRLRTLGIELRLALYPPESAATYALQVLQEGAPHRGTLVAARFLAEAAPADPTDALLALRPIVPAESRWAVDYGLALQGAPEHLASWEAEVGAEAAQVASGDSDANLVPAAEAALVIAGDPEGEIGVEPAVGVLETFVEDPQLRNVLRRAAQSLAERDPAEVAAMLQYLPPEVRDFVEQAIAEEGAG